MNERRTYTVYDLGMGDAPLESRKVAVFYDDSKAIWYANEMGKYGERYGVFDVTGNRLDEE